MKPQRWVVKRPGGLYWELGILGGDEWVADRKLAAHFVALRAARAIAQSTGGTVLRLVPKGSPVRGGAGPEKEEG